MLEHVDEVLRCKGNHVGTLNVTSCLHSWAIGMHDNQLILAGTVGEFSKSDPTWKTSTAANKSSGLWIWERDGQRHFCFVRGCLKCIGDSNYEQCPLPHCKAWAPSFSGMTKAARAIIMKA